MCKQCAVCITASLKNISRVNSFDSSALAPNCVILSDGAVGYEESQPSGYDVVAFSVDARSRITSSHYQVGKHNMGFNCLNTYLKKFEESREKFPVNYWLPDGEKAMVNVNSLELIKKEKIRLIDSLPE